MKEDTRLRLAGAGIGVVVVSALKLLGVHGFPWWAVIIGGIGVGSFLLAAAANAARPA